MAVKFSQFLSEALGSNSFLVGYNSVTNQNVRVSYANLVNAFVGGSGTTNYITKWTGSTALGNSQIFDNGTQIGIGTISPLTSAFAQFQKDQNSITQVVVRNDNSGTNAQSGFAAYNSAFNNTGVVILAKYGTGFSGYKIISANDGGIYNSQGDIFFLNDNPSGRIKFNTGNNSNVQMVVFPTGNVGIAVGTTDAGYRLDVTGTFRSTLDANINGLKVGKGGGSQSSNTAFGIDALLSNTTGNENVAIGSGSIRSNTTGQQNVSVGTNALRVGTVSYNTAVGHQALYNSTGASNIAVGYNSGYNITSGANNVIIGTGLNGITTGSNNTIIGNGITGLSSSLSNTIILADGQGNQRLVMNSTLATIGTNASINGTSVGRGNANREGVTVVGQFSGGALTSSGTTNTFVGYYAGRRVTDGSSNVLLGYQSGQALVTGYQNVAVGNNALYSATNYENTAVGFAAGESVTTGIRNVLVGYAAGTALGAGSFSTLLGYSAGSSMTSGYNVGVGFFAGYQISTGTQNTIVGTQTGYGITTGSNNTIIGSKVQGLSSSLSNHTIIADGDGNMRLVAFNDGNVYIGGSTTLPTNGGQKLQVVGTARITSNTTIGGPVSINTTTQPSNVELYVVANAPASRVRYQNTYTNGVSIYQILNDASVEAGLLLNGSTAASANEASVYSTGVFNVSGSIVKINTNSLERMRVFNNGNISVGGTTDVASALFQVDSTTKGFLPPRMTGLQAEAITSPAAGLLIYSTDGSGTTITSAGWWGYDGAAWVKLN
jgi:hypothetical protein